MTGLLVESNESVKPFFRKVLVANRGEIAVRIMRTLREMGISSVALASDPDRQAEHVRAADEVIFLPGDTPTQTYLQGETIVLLARQAGVDAIHPGYGFLSENAGFARACRDAGITFIGPDAEVIRAMGDKIVAKDLMGRAGVPVLPGWSGPPDVDFAEVRRQAEAIGYPLLIKAAAGGGGKGMRLVEHSDGLEAAWSASSREARSAFGDARVFLEKYVARSRHIEFQILGDHHGNIVHLFERECSIQRRHQKIIEETPSPGLDPDLRARMAEASCRAARAAGYANAGTVEWVLADDGNFYFLEVNTRLQVEHPITEMTTQLDLVRLQVMIAAGLPLPFLQADIRRSGHAVECRIYAEDPARDFMPNTGRLDFFRPPEGPFIRLDSGVREGWEVSPHYDPMLAKLIVWGPDRPAALRKMSEALGRFVILGVTGNTSFLKKVVDHPAFAAGETHTHFLTEHGMLTGRMRTSDDIPEEALMLAGLSDRILNGGNGKIRRPPGAPAESASGSPSGSPWVQGGAWGRNR